MFLSRSPAAPTESRSSGPYDLLAATNNSPAVLPELFSQAPETVHTPFHRPFPYASSNGIDELSDTSQGFSVGSQLETKYQLFRRRQEAPKTPQRFYAPEVYASPQTASRFYSPYSPGQVAKLKTPAEVPTSKYDHRVIIQEDLTL